MKAREALERALGVIRRDQLAAWVQVEDALAGLLVECVVGGERFWVEARPDLCVVPGATEQSSALARTDGRTILDLIDGEITLLEAVKCGRLDVLADTSVLLRLARAQRAFAEGAARAKDVQPVLERYRGAVMEEILRTS